MREGKDDPRLPACISDGGWWLVAGGTVSGFWYGNHRRWYHGHPSTPSPGAATGALGIAVVPGRAMRRKKKVKLGHPLIIIVSRRQGNRAQGGRS